MRNFLSAARRACRPRVPRAAGPLALAVLCAVLGAGLSGCRTVKSWNAKRVASLPRFRIVRPTIAYEIMRDNPDILIVDLRSRAEFNDDHGHLRNASNVPLNNLKRRLRELAAFREETFLVYCRGEGPCAEQGMKLLSESGFSDAILIEGGIDAWLNAGMKTYLPVSAVGRVNLGLAPEIEPVKPVRELPVLPDKPEVTPEPPPPPVPPPPAGG
jgi:rhodanese-related sulfurtransferase